MKNHLNTCPKCSSNLKISGYTCPVCKTIVTGDFQGCQFCGLDEEDRLFALVFLQTEGNMKDVERLMGISYPTVKSKLKNLNEKLGGKSREFSLELNLSAEIINDRKEIISPDEKSRILDRLSAGEVDAVTAGKLLRGEKIDIPESETTDDESE